MPEKREKKPPKYRELEKLAKGLLSVAPEELEEQKRRYRQHKEGRPKKSS